MRCAEEAAVPAGGALAVDRERFADLVTSHIMNHPNIEVLRDEVREVPLAQPAIVATGPLTSPALADAIGKLTGEDYLYFYDAISPIARASSIDMNRAFRANRYGRGEQAAGDYINCPLDKDEYYQFVGALKTADTIELRDFEREDPNFFEGCVPIEQLAKAGRRYLGFRSNAARRLDESAYGRAPIRRRAAAAR